MTRPVPSTSQYAPGAQKGGKGVPHARGGGKMVGADGKLIGGKGMRTGKGKGYWASKRGRSVEEEHNKKLAGEHVVDNDVIRLARRAGIERLAQDVYPEAKRQLENFVHLIVRDAVTYMENSLDEIHRGEEYDVNGNVIIDEMTDAVVMKEDVPTYGGCIGAKHVMSALERNGVRLYWHRQVTR